MRTSEQINEIAAALVKAQAKVEGAVRDKSNPAFRSKYADLGAVWDAIREPFSEAGIAIVQTLSKTEIGVACCTRLIHPSGQWIEDTLEMPVLKADAQGHGSAATYARRYSLMAMTGIAPIDDDGNAASGKAEQPKPEQSKAEQPKPVDVEGWIKTLKGCNTRDELVGAWGMAKLACEEANDTSAFSILKGARDVRAKEISKTKEAAA